MNSPYYSIVIPVYKTEAYIGACVDSILAQQDAPAFELILVDNGSPDRAGEICEEYAAKDPRVRVLHQQNRGPGGGRNAGLQAATGEYVLFVDSDDLLVPDHLKTLEPLRKDQPDVMAFSYYILWSDNGTKEARPQPVIPNGESGMEWLERMFAINRLPHQAPWCYGFRREFLEEKGLCYREDLIGPEDFEFNMRVIPEAASVAGSEKCLYLWCIRQDSTSIKVDETSYAKMEKELPFYIGLYRRFPVPVLAQVFIGYASKVGRFPKSLCGEALKTIQENKDIFDHVPRCFQQIMVPLSHLFGFHFASRVYLRLLDFKMSHSFTRTLHMPRRCK